MHTRSLKPDFLFHKDNGSLLASQRGREVEGPQRRAEASSSLRCAGGNGRPRGSQRENLQGSPGRSRQREGGPMDSLLQLLFHSCSQLIPEAALHGT